MEDKIRRIMDDSTDYQTGEVDAEIAISKLLVLFNVMNKELEFCECKPNTDIYSELVTKCNKCSKEVTTLRIK